MDQQTVTLKLPQTLLNDVSNVASTQNVTIGHLVRELLKNEVDRRLKARTPQSGLNAHMAGTKVLLATELELADGWDDLAVRLCDHGYEMRSDGKGIAIYRRPCGTRVFKAADLGFTYQSLVRRFECAMPGHPHGVLIKGDLSLLPIQHSLPLEGDATFEVIDRDT